MKTPCHQDPEAWVGDNVYDRLEAARQCLACPELTQCSIAALRNPPDFGVQAGIDYTPRTPKKPRVDNCTTCALPMLGYAGKRQTCPACVETRSCEYCGELFERTVKSSQKQWDARRVCGVRCAAMMNQGRRVA